MGAREFIEKIINKIKRPKQQFLTGNIDSGYDKAKEFRERNRADVSIDNYKNEESIDECILEYISQYIKQLQIGTNEDVSYKAFTRMFYEGQEEVGKNAENQEKLKQKIHRSKKYRVDGQYSVRGKPIFYHISQNTSEGQKITDKDENIYKIYLNCERKDISRLAGEILKRLDKIDNCAFRMKFMAESDESEVSKRYQRNDKIVLYTSEEIDKERIINCLAELKRKKPELFSDRKKLPLMPKVNGFIGCVRQGKNQITTPLYENKYADTYNNRLATIMEDCMIASIRQIAERDNVMSGNLGEDPKASLNVYQIMNQEQVKQVVQIFKTQFVQCCAKSQVPINVGKDTQNQQR